MKAFLLIDLFLLSGCAGLVHELKTDPAIVGTTGLWISLGFEPSITTGGIPAPALKFGYGTLWRVGPQDEVTVLIGGGAGSGPPPADTAGASTAGQLKALPRLSGDASLYIHAKGASKVLKPMKGLYQANPGDNAK